MTLRRKLPFKHIGGPADGANMHVEVDADGTPPEFYVLLALGNMDFGIDPAGGLSSDVLNSMYEREDRLGDDGFEYVFVYRGTDVEHPPAPPMAA